MPRAVRLSIQASGSKTVQLTTADIRSSALTRGATLEKASAVQNARVGDLDIDMGITALYLKPDSE
jgi:hypothetical protein